MATKKTTTKKIQPGGGTGSASGSGTLIKQSPVTGGLNWSKQPSGSDSLMKQSPVTGGQKAQPATGSTRQYIRYVDANGNVVLRSPTQPANQPTTQPEEKKPRIKLRFV